MKKLALFLALVLAFSVVPLATVSAEDATAAGFVIDGQLDEYYRSDDWAQENNCYLYFNSLYDTTLDLVSKEPGTPCGVEDVMEFNEELSVEIYVAYDSDYAYFYVEVIDPNIATQYQNADGSFSDTSQYLDGIEFFVDTDTMSCDGDFNSNLTSYENADCHFRLTAHNFAITDFISAPKYNLVGEAGETTGDYFANTENVFPFYTYDDSNNIIGYGCEARFPLAYKYDSMYTDFYYNIAVQNSPTDDDPTRCAVTTGKRWWLAYDTGKTVFLEETNPFLGTPLDPDPITPSDSDVDPVQNVKNLIAALPEEVTLEDKAAVDAAVAALDALTDEQYEQMTEDELTKLLDAAISMAYLELEAYLGDVDKSGKVDAADALAVLKYAVGKGEMNDQQLLYADVNVDDKIDASDALDMLKFAVGKLDQFEAYDFYFGEI